MIVKHKRKFAILLFVIAVLITSVNLSSSVAAQKKQEKTPPCPTTKVFSPDEVKKGDPLTFTANVSGGDPNVTPTYNWSVSAGSIESGQGTSTIQVDTKEVEGNMTVTATVDVGGYSRECGYGSTAASATTNITKKPEARKIDEYGKLKPGEEETKLSGIKLYLDQEGGLAKAYVITYGGRGSLKGEAQKAADKAKTILVKKFGVDASLIVAVDGGLREQPMLELWIVPDGAAPPQPTPTVKPDAANPAAPKPSKNKKS